MSREKNRVKNATVDRRVQSKRMKVKMNQPLLSCQKPNFLKPPIRAETHYQVQTKFIEKFRFAYSVKRVHDGEAPGCENDGK